VPSFVFRPNNPVRAEISSTRHDELAALAIAVQRGDTVALRTFLTTIVPHLLRIVRRVLGPEHPDLEDVTYEAAYATVEGLSRFRGEGTVKHFACRVAVLTAMNVRRRDSTAKRARQREIVDFDGLPSDHPGPEQNLLSASLVPIVRDLVATLPQPLAEALTLHVILGYTVPEIVEACGAREETVRSRLRLAKQALRRRVLGNPALREVLGADP
jgi:RNA polymerase sigma factor (sigma-70 family)